MINNADFSINHFLGTGCDLEEHLKRWENSLRKAANNGDLISSSKTALGLAEIPAKLQEINTQIKENRYFSRPEVILLANEYMYGRSGAYSSTNGKIYLNQDWLKTASFAETTRVLNEEFGHHLDNLLNSKDTKGDEGEYFAELLLRAEHGQTSNESDKLEFLSEDDHGKIAHNGSMQSVEFSMRTEYANGTIFTDPIAGAAKIIGNHKNQNINAGSGNDWVYGKGGNDKIAGQTGQDNLFGGDGNDDLNGNTSGTVDTSKGYYFGGSGNDVIRGGKKNDVIRGDANDNAQETTNNIGHDALAGFQGHDLISGGLGNDLLLGHLGQDRLTGGAGADLISAGPVNGNKWKFSHIFQHDGDSVIWTDAGGLESSPTLTSGSVIQFNNGVDTLFNYNHRRHKLYLPNNSFNLLTSGDSLTNLTLGENYFIQGTWSRDNPPGIYQFRDNHTNYLPGSFTVGASSKWNEQTSYLALYNAQSSNFFNAKNTNFLVLEFDYLNGSSPGDFTDKLPSNTYALTKTPLLISGPAGNPGDRFASFSLQENIKAVHNYTNTSTKYFGPFTKSSLRNPLTYWFIRGGADQSLFTIDQSTGALEFINAPAFDNKLDANGDGIYEVDIHAVYSSYERDAYNLKGT